MSEIKNTAMTAQVAEVAQQAAIESKNESNGVICLDLRKAKDLAIYKQTVEQKSFLSAANRAIQPLGENPSMDALMEHAALAEASEMPHVKAAMTKTGRIGASVFKFMQYTAEGKPVFGSGLAKWSQSYAYTKDDADKGIRKGDVRKSLYGSKKFYKTADDVVTRDFDGITYALVPVVAKHFVVTYEEDGVVYKAESDRYQWKDIIASLMGDTLPASERKEVLRKEEAAKQSADAKAKVAKWNEEADAKGVDRKAYAELMRKAERKAKVAKDFNDAKKALGIK